MGADLEDVSVSRIESTMDHRFKGRRVIVYLGTLQRIRRIDFLFEVLARVKEEVPEVVLVLAGDSVEPSDVAWLRQRAEETGVAEDVVWTG